MAKSLERNESLPTMLRTPHTINENTHIEYTPHQAALELLGEKNRKLKHEDFSWAQHICPTLIEYCIWAIRKHFEEKPVFHELLCADSHYLLEILPLDLPLTLVVPLIEEEIYWQRRYNNMFSVILSKKRQNWTWKSLFLERYMRKVIEEAQPQYGDEECMDELLKMVKPYIKRLIVYQLQNWNPPLTGEKDEIPEVYPTDHISFKPILEILDNIVELDIKYGLQNVGFQFNWNMFKVSVADCRRIGEAIKYLKVLKILRVHESALEDDHIQALMQAIIKNKTIIEMDLSNCLYGDHGALCIAKFMMTHPALEKLRLTNNRIGPKGGEGIGFALLQKCCCPLISLDLRLNPLDHQGCMGLFRALVRTNKPSELNIAACGFDDDTSERFADIFALNHNLRKVDVSCNWFTPTAGETLLKNLQKNHTIEWIDLRDTELAEEIIDRISKSLLRNRHGILDEDEDDKAYRSNYTFTEDHRESKASETMERVIKVVLPDDTDRTGPAITIIDDRVSSYTGDTGITDKILMNNFPKS